MKYPAGYHDRLPYKSALWTLRAELQGISRLQFALRECKQESNSTSAGTHHYNGFLKIP